MKKIISFVLSIAMLSAYAANAAAAEVTYKEYRENEIAATNKYADADYVFELGSEKFTLLDSSENESSKYFVVANQVYERKYIKTDSFTSTAETSLNHWLNNDFISEDFSGNKLNSKIIAHIDNTHVWGLDPSAAIAEGTSFTAGITIPSVSEMTAYGSIMGYADPEENYATRTQLTGTTKSIVIYDKAKSNVSETSWKLANRNNNALSYIRPIFWLDDKFFVKVPLDLTKAGAKVKEEIKKIDVNELLKIYSANYLIENLGIAPPEGYVSIKKAKVITLSGNQAANGETLKASFEYDPENKYDMASARFKWERVSDEGATEVGSGETYVVTEADTINGKYAIRFNVTVTDTSGNSTEHNSELTGKIPVIAARSYAPNVNISMTKDEDNTDYKFTFGGKSFTLVDTFNNDKSTFFVVPNDSYGQAGMNSAYFDPNDQAGMAYTMNTTFVNNGLDSGLLPQEIIDHIDFDHMWVCESAPLCPNEKVNESYAFKAGVTLLSFSEIEKYRNIMATVGNLSGYSRTAANFKNTAAGKEELNYINTIKWNDGNSAIWANHWDTIDVKNNVKPVFYLGKSFFKEVAIDWETVGTKALEMLNKVYTVEDFGGLYADELLEQKGFKHNYELSAAASGLSGGAASLSGTVTSNIAESGSGILIFVVYDEGGAAVASKAEKIEFNGKETKSFSLSTESLAQGSYTAKAMLWDNLFDANAQIRHVEYK